MSKKWGVWGAAIGSSTTDSASMDYRSREFSSLVACMPCSGTSNAMWGYQLCSHKMSCRGMSSISWGFASLAAPSRSPG